MIENQDSDHDYVMVPDIKRLQQHYNKEYDLLIEFNNLLKIFSKKSINEVNEAYNKAVKMLLNKSFNEWSMPNIIKMLIPLMNTSCKPLEKEYSLVLLNTIAKDYPRQIKTELTELVPAVSNLYWDTKPAVQNTAKAVLSEIIKCCGNKDLDPFFSVTFNLP